MYYILEDDRGLINTSITTRAAHSQATTVEAEVQRQTKTPRQCRETINSEYLHEPLNY